ncbi:MAG: sn-glycerol-3-phosphate ABC transporter substrate-binding protein UgpB [Desulfobacterales bacterium]
MKLRKPTVILLAAAFVLIGIGDALAAPTEIQWWHAMRGAREDSLVKIVDAFNASQDQFKVVATNKGNYDEVIVATVAAYRARKHPHIMQSFEVGTLTMMLSGAIYPVYQLMADRGHQIDWQAYIQPVLSYYVDANDNLLSMPFNSSTPVMYYNKALFEKAGLEPLSKTEAVTWDEMGDITAKLVAAGAPKGMVTGWQSWLQIENYSAIHDLPFATKDNGYAGLDCELTINNDQVVKHIERLKSWMADNRFSYEGRKYQGPQGAFIAQNAAIYMDSISAIGALKKNAQFDWDVAPLPVEADMANPQNSIIGGASLFVMKGFSEKEYQGVADFLAFMARPEIQADWHVETGYFPITMEAYEALKTKGFYDQEPYQEVGLQQITRRKPTPNSRGLRLGYFPTIRDIINEEMELVWNNSKTPRQALDDAVKRSNDKLREFEKTNK